MAEPIIHRCPRPSTLVSLNTDLSWFRRQRHKTEWLDAGYYAGVALRNDLRRKGVNTPLPRSRIQFDTDVDVVRRRDGHNLVLCAKWFIDGLVLSRLFADDDVDHVVLDDWTFRKVNSKQLELRVTITEAP